MAESEEENKKKRGQGELKILHFKTRQLFFLLPEKTILTMRMLVAKGGMKGRFQLKFKELKYFLYIF